MPTYTFQDRNTTVTIRPITPAQAQNLKNYDEILERSLKQQTITAPQNIRCFQDCSDWGDELFHETDAAHTAEAFFDTLDIAEFEDFDESKHTYNV